MIMDQVVKSEQTKNCAFFVFLLVCLLQQNQGNCLRSETANWKVAGSPFQLKSLKLQSDFLDRSSERNIGGLGRRNISIWRMGGKNVLASTSTKIEGAESRKWK